MKKCAVGNQKQEKCNNNFDSFKHFKIRKPLSLLLPQKFPVTLVVKHNFGRNARPEKSCEQQHRKKVQ